MDSDLVMAAVAGTGATIGGFAAIIRSLQTSKPEAGKIVVDAAVDLVQGLGQRVAALEAAASQWDERERGLRAEIAALRSELAETREALAEATHERDEALLREGSLRKRLARVEQELAEFKANRTTT